jgi:hypothetical protein
MKIIKNLHKKSYLIISLLLLISLLSLTKIKSFDCTPDIGCLGRHKYMSYVTVVSKEGKPLLSQSITNFKVIYIFKDRLVFYSSSDTGNASLEAEDNSSIDMIESKILRVINFGDIILDCGKFKNQLCHAQEYKGIDQIESFKLVKQTARTVPESLCILIPFFENGYKLMHDKIAFICGTQVKDLYDIISFKHSVSRNIEFYQLNNSLDRYSSSNGLLHKQLNMIINAGGKPKTVLAKFFNKGISFIDTELKLLHFYFSFNDLRKSGFGPFRVKEGLKKDKVPKDWGKGLSSPVPDCCIYFHGEFNKLAACLAEDNGSPITSEDICIVKIDKLFGVVRSSYRGVIFSEAFHQISTNKLKAKDCKSKEFGVFKYRLLKSADYAIENDCKLVMNYMNEEDIQKKTNWCKKNFNDEINLEKRLMTLGNEEINEAIQRCVLDVNPELFNEKKFNGKFLIKKSSFNYFSNLNFSLKKFTNFYNQEFLIFNFLFLFLNS